ncbi:hypothetical protein J7M23_00165 [Candidatus Sumerlaeota bacterium]|nr:hypothetical protein [Candidatus Sumerlaeota bacterium]
MNNCLESYGSVRYCQTFNKIFRGCGTPRHKRRLREPTKYLLCDMGLHHPPMHSLNANRAYYTLSALAHNLLQGIKLLYLPSFYYTKRNHTLLITSCKSLHG